MWDFVCNAKKKTCQLNDRPLKHTYYYTLNEYFTRKRWWGRT